VVQLEQALDAGSGDRETVSNGQRDLVRRQTCGLQDFHLGDPVHDLGRNHYRLARCIEPEVETFSHIILPEIFADSILQRDREVTGSLRNWRSPATTRGAGNPMRGAGTSDASRCASEGTVERQRRTPALGMRPGSWAKSEKNGVGHEPDAKAVEP